MLLKFVTGIFVGDRLVWELNLTPKQVIDKLVGKNEGTWIERMFAPGIGVRTFGNRFSFSKASIRNIPMSGNAFTHVLVGRVDETVNGSRVTARFRLPLHVFVFAIIWLGGAFGICSLAVSSMLRNAMKTGHFDKPEGLLFMMGFPLGGLLFLNISRRIARANELEIQAAIQECLDPHRLN